MPDYDDYYSHDELKETTFDGFKVTSIDPGNALLISIAGVAILYVLMSLIFLKWTKGKKITHDVDCTYLNRIYSRYNGPNNHNGTTELEIPILDCSSDILPIPDTSGKYLDGETVREIKKMLDLACP